MSEMNETEKLLRSLAKVEDWSARSALAMRSHVEQSHPDGLPEDCETCFELVVAGEESANRIRAGRNELFARKSGLA
jgi:hypothetical protein